MSLSYYQESENFPKILKAASERVLIYTVRTLYPNEANSSLINTLKNRIVLANIEAGNDVVIGDAIDNFKKTNLDYPWTAYNVKDSDYNEEEFNHAAKAGFTYCSDVGKYVSTWPKFGQMSLITFFSKADDHQRARTILDNQSVSLTRLTFPILINGVEYFVPIDIGFEISNGSYATQFEEYLRVNRIWDLVHNIEIKYYDFYLEDVTVGLVDNMVLRIGDTDDKGNALPNTDVITADSAPEVISTSPEDESINVSIDATIKVTFINKMDEDSVLDAFSTIPVISGEMLWNDEGTEFNFIPNEQLDPETLYTITISTTAVNAIQHKPLPQDYVFDFTTG